jgi:DNA-directed RNA polymerase specialized sigma24 family protein
MARIAQDLDREWDGIATGPLARRTVIRWANAHQALAGLVDLDDVLAARRQAGRADPILRALVTMAADDDLAARTLLQALLPGLVHLARTAGNDDHDAVEELISLAWERIRTYPVGREGSVAGNVLLDVKKRYRAHRRIEAPGEWAEMATDPPSSSWTPEDEVIAHSVFEQLRDAELDGHVMPRAAAMIVRTRVHGETLVELAREQGTTAAAIGQRRWRAERRLRELRLVG